MKWLAVTIVFASSLAQAQVEAWICKPQRVYLQAHVFVNLQNCDKRATPDHLPPITVTTQKGATRQNDPYFKTIYEIAAGEGSSDHFASVSVSEPQGSWRIDPESSLRDMGSFTIEEFTKDGYRLVHDTHLTQPGLGAPARQLAFQKEYPNRKIAWICVRIIADAKHNAFYILDKGDDNGDDVDSALSYQYGGLATQSVTKFFDSLGVD